MGEYDIALKSILTRGGGSVLTRLTGLAVKRWLSGELPDVRIQQADLLGETGDGTLVHVELQSTNDTRMAARMLEYAVAIHRRFDRYPRQLVLYVGDKPARMKDRIEEPDLTFRCAISDIRVLDGEALLASDSLEDNLIGILGRVPDEAAAVRRVLAKIAESAPELRAGALAELTILARLRNLVPLLEKETERMPILEDIMDHEIIGRERKRGIAIGREEGREEGERKVIFSLLEERFGSLSASARERIDKLGAPELETLARRLLKAASIDELLG
jgi:predicted transposase YdaD